MRWRCVLGFVLAPCVLDAGGPNQITSVLETEPPFDFGDNMLPLEPYSLGRHLFRVNVEHLTFHTDLVEVYVDVAPSLAAVVNIRREQPQRFQPWRSI